MGRPRPVRPRSAPGSPKRGEGGPSPNNPRSSAAQRARKSQFFSADFGTRFTVTKRARNSSSMSSLVFAGIRFTKSSSGGSGAVASGSASSASRPALARAPLPVRSRPCSRCSARKEDSSSSLGPIGAPSSGDAPEFPATTLLAGASSSPPAAARASSVLRPPSPAPVDRADAALAPLIGLSRFFLSRPQAGSRPASRFP